MSQPSCDFATQELARHAEQMQAQLEAARAASQASSAQISGSVRIATTDTVPHGLVAPALQSLKLEHPFLTFDLHTGNELASLTRCYATRCRYCCTRYPSARRLNRSTPHVSSAAAQRPVRTKR
jgi:hypothetical protein